ncbi:TetR family transcriptional regulator [Listeria floridensis FSL S10-1187]|uniref:TetR family transcriptional regulator n=1 Tax=Listeria floridensis FSL S10-1187 TaxID=1265817 RepID=A0ABP3B1M1_9LIST|nr:TetR family transcriptional regulator [Listeria floridensis]EUJ33834.1 TetR family transcriptional regulator [Listeria floridensis FSL S10-1187]
MKTRERIIESAIEVIQDEGIANYSLAKVAKKAGMTKAAIFYHFENKDELTLSLIHYTIQAYEHILQEEFEKTDEKTNFPFTEAYVNGNLRQLDDKNLVGLHGALLATVVSGEVGNHEWHDAYAHDFNRLVPEIGADQAELLRYAIDGMWHARILGMPEFEAANRKQVADFLMGIIKQKK